MEITIIYDTYFGNTQKIAEEIGKVLNAKVLNVKEVNVEDIERTEILIVGSPTRAFRPTEKITKFFNSLPKDILIGKKIASFDTRANLEDVNSKFLTFMVKLFGYAAEPISKILIKKGGEQILEPMGFYIQDSEGPLKDGEVLRVKDWLYTYFK